MRALRSNRILENGEKHRNGMFLNWHHTMNWHGRLLLLFNFEIGVLIVFSSSMFCVH